MVHLTGATRIGFYTDADGWGGAEIALQTLLESLPPTIEPVVIGPAPPVVDRLARAAGRAGGAVVTTAHARSGLEARRGLGRLFRWLCLDLLHANRNRMTACSEALLAAATIGLPAVAVEHTTIGPQSRAGSLSAQVLARTVRAHVAVGARSARTVERMLHLRPDTVRVLHNGVRDRGAVRPDHHGGPVVLGTLGYGHRVKGLDVLVRALPSVPGARVVMVGAAEAEPELAALAETVGVADRVVCTPWVSNPQQALAGFDALVLPSRQEGLPLSVLEAMMGGLPVVASDVGSVAEAVVDGHTGFLVPPDQPEPLGRALAAIAADPGRRRAMGDAGRMRALVHFTADEMVRRYVALYREVLAPGRTGGGGRGGAAIRVAAPQRPDASRGAEVVG